jgi:hypothetical protein
MFTIPDAVLATLKERVSKLNSFTVAETEASEFTALLESTISSGSVPHQFALDLAIVTTRLAHAFDKTDNEFIFQEPFRQKKYLRSTIVDRIDILEDCETMTKVLRPGRVLTQVERDTFVEMHQICRSANELPPLLEGSKMDAFLDAQLVYEIGSNVEDVGFHGISLVPRELISPFSARWTRHAFR